jgi:hypothetical protein
LNLYGEQHQLLTFPQGLLPTFSGDGSIDPKKHVEIFLSLCEIHLVEHDDVMVRLFLQTLTDQDHEWYMSLPINSISTFDDFEDMFLTMYVPPKAYHTLRTKFTQIRLKKCERIMDFNFRFLRMLNQIQENRRPNDPVILGCYKNAMLLNDNFSMRASQIEDLNGAMNKAMEMEEIMLETDVDPNIILGKVQREIDTLTISDQGASSSRRIEDQRTRNTGDRGISGGILKGVIPNVTNDPTMT